MLIDDILKLDLKESVGFKENEEEYTKLYNFIINSDDNLYTLLAINILHKGLCIHPIINDDVLEYKKILSDFKEAKNLENNYFRFLDKKPMTENELEIIKDIRENGELDIFYYNNSKAIFGSRRVELKIVYIIYDYIAIQENGIKIDLKMESFQKINFYKKVDYREYIRGKN